VALPKIKSAFTPSIANNNTRGAFTETASDAISKTKAQKSMDIPANRNSFNISIPKISPSWSPVSNELSNPSSSSSNLNFDQLIKSDDNDSSLDR
jgi:hypothetical protein